jgi:hypothetical protein
VSALDLFADTSKRKRDEKISLTLDIYIYIYIYIYIVIYIAYKNAIKKRKSRKDYRIAYIFFKKFTKVLDLDNYLIYLKEYNYKYYTGLHL